MGEIITAGHYQNLYPNPCKHTEEGVFGSKFVTVCITGNKDCEVEMMAYQVSNQCMALVNDKIIVPTKDAPELAYIVESSEANTSRTYSSWRRTSTGMRSRRSDDLCL